MIKVVIIIFVTILTCNLLIYFFFPQIGPNGILSLNIIASFAMLLLKSIISCIQIAILKREPYKIYSEVRLARMTVYLLFLFCFINSVEFFVFFIHLDNWIFTQTELFNAIKNNPIWAVSMIATIILILI